MVRFLEAQPDELMEDYRTDIPNPDAKSRADDIWVVLNWFEELKQLVPTGR